MNPKVDAVLRDIAQQINEEVCPAVDGYHRGTLTMAAVMLTMAADRWDSAAHDLVSENRAIRALLRDGAGLVDAEESHRFQSLIVQVDDDLRISALGETNDLLRDALIELHTALDAQDNSAARSMSDRIWEELRYSTERRKLSAAPF